MAHPLHSSLVVSAESYVLVTAARAARRALDLLTFEPALAAPFDFAIETLTRREVADVRRDDRFIGMAPPIPFKLHEPVEGSTETGSAPAELPWGLEAVGATRSSRTGKGVVVAVLDTGIDLDHEAFRHLRGRITTKNFTADPDDDRNGHGTHCAATIFGGEVLGTRVGVAPGIAQAYVGKVLGSDTSTSTLVQAILWALQSGAHIVAMSVGMDYPALVARYTARGLPLDIATSRALSAFAANVQLFGALSSFLGSMATVNHSMALLIAASGNESRRAENREYVVNAAPPAAAPDFLAVGAITRAGGGHAVAPYSNTGVAVAAPGSQVLSARAGGGLRLMSGTSMATPHVAGVAALWAEQVMDDQGRLTTSVIRARLEAHATRQSLPRDTPLDDVGSGLVQAPR